MCTLRIAKHTFTEHDSTIRAANHTYYVQRCRDASIYSVARVATRAIILLQCVCSLTGLKWFENSYRSAVRALSCEFYRLCRCWPGGIGAERVHRRTGWRRREGGMSAISELWLYFKSNCIGSTFTQSFYQSPLRLVAWKGAKLQCINLMRGDVLILRINFKELRRTAPLARFVQIHFVSAEFFGGNRAAATIGTLPAPPIDLPLTVSRIRAPCFRVTIAPTGNFNCDSPLMCGNSGELIVCANSFDTREMAPLSIERSSELDIVFSHCDACTYSLVV